MAKRKMNVLVYSGKGSSPNSVRHCLIGLRGLLSPHYAVIPVTERVVLYEPWTTSCALLVFPGGADLAYCQTLDGNGNRIIAQYVRRGGAYLGFCAGGYYASSRCEFEMGNKDLEVVGPRELSFYPGTCRGCAFKGFKYNSEAGARAVEVTVVCDSFNTTIARPIFRCYYNGGGVFVDSKKFQDKGVEILASYTHPLDVDAGDAPTAMVYIKFGEGKVILTGPHPEFAAANLDRQTDNPEYSKIIEALAEDEASRVEFLRACLGKLGLLTNHEEYKPLITTEDKEYIKGENDTFCLERKASKRTMTCPSESLALSDPNNTVELLGNQMAELNIPDSNAIIKHLIAHEIEWPEIKETPYFDHHEFYANLRMYQEEKGSEAEEFGKYLLYGEIVTSTNTMLEKNTRLLSELPTGFTFTATTQLAGRGRGSNVWISPKGSLIMSVCIKHAMSLNATAPVVFVQYLAAMAIVEGIKSYDKGHQTVPVKLKWPNDIYALDPSKSGVHEYVKIGGILVNSSFSTDTCTLIVGIGLNTTNEAPTVSLNALLSPGSTLFTQEKLLARILTMFECLYKRFCRAGFDSKLEALYYLHWLHTNQIVTLETQGCARVRIKGISRNWGFLKAEELGREDKPTGKVWELQSDSNSFDFFKGLLKARY